MAHASCVLSKGGRTFAGQQLAYSIRCPDSDTDLGLVQVVDLFLELNVLGEELE